MVDIRPLGNTDDIQREADERKLDAQLAPLPARATKPIDTESMEYIFTYKLPLLNYLLAMVYVQIIALLLFTYLIRLALGRGLGSFPSVEPVWIDSSSAVSGYVTLAVAIFLVLTLLSRAKLLRYIAIFVAVCCIGYLAFSIGMTFTTLSEYGAQAIQYSVIAYGPYVVLMALMSATVFHLLRPKIARVYRK